MSHILAIDPGTKGCMCLLNMKTNLMDFWELPYIKSEPDIQGTIDLFEEIKNEAINHETYYGLTVYLEKAQSMPGNGGAAMFRYGRANGILEAILATKKFRYHLVHPRVWSKEMHKGVSEKLDGKSKSRVAVQMLFPGVNLMRTAKCKKPDEGRIDALLIAEYGARCERGTKKL